MEPDLDVKYANETMDEWSELQIADYCLVTGNFFWDLIACIDRKWVPKLFDSYLIALNTIKDPEILEEFLRTSMDAFVWRAGRENDLIGQIAGMVADRRFPNEIRSD